MRQRLGGKAENEKKAGENIGADLDRTTLLYATC